MASHCPSRKRLSSPSIWRNSDSAFALLMTLGDRIGSLAAWEIHFKDSFNTNWLCVSMTVFLQVLGVLGSSRGFSNLRTSSIEIRNARRFLRRALFLSGLVT